MMQHLPEDSRRCRSFFLVILNSLNSLHLLLRGILFLWKIRDRMDSLLQASPVLLPRRLIHSRRVIRSLDSQVSLLMHNQHLMHRSSPPMHRLRVILSKAADASSRMLHHPVPAVLLHRLLLRNPSSPRRRIVFFPGF